MREQAEKLGIMGTIQSMLSARTDLRSPRIGNLFPVKDNVEMPPIKKEKHADIEQIQDMVKKNKLALKRELDERKKIQEELGKLEERKNHFARAQEQSKMPNIIQKRQNSDERIKKPVFDPKERSSVDGVPPKNSKEKLKKRRTSACCE